MASEKITAIVESVKTMTVLELKELVDTICEEFGVSAVAAAAPVIRYKKDTSILYEMQGPCNTVKFRGMYKETRKFLLRYTKKHRAVLNHTVLKAIW